MLLTPSSSNRLLSIARRSFSTTSHNMVKIGTHSGTFHCDEALAVHLLRNLPEYKDAELVRTRDPELLKTCDIVVDVGGVYDDSKKLYDHHQREFQDTYSLEHKTRLSSAGLVYKHYASRIISKLLSLEESHESIPVLVRRVYDTFIEDIDGVDNGVDKYVAVNGGPVKQAYGGSSSLSSRISKLNPRWNEPADDNLRDERFEIASALAGAEFFAHLAYTAEAWLPARDVVSESLNKRKTISDGDSQGRIMIFEDTCPPWKEHLYNLETELKINEDEKPLYIIYPDEHKKWRVQCVPVSPESFQSRKPLPESWRGVRDSQLSELTGIPECIFVHASGFIGGNITREGALQMAKKSLTL